MMKKQEGKLSIKEMLSKVNTKTVDPIHRGRIMRMLHGHYGTGDADDFEPNGFYIVRIAFPDFGDLVIDCTSMAYLLRVHRTLDDMYHFGERSKDDLSKLENVEYSQYLDWLALEAVTEFIYLTNPITDEEVDV